MNTTPENEWRKEFRKKYVRGYGPKSLPNGEMQEAEAWIEADIEDLESFIENLRAAAYHRGQEDMKRKAIEDTIGTIGAKLLAKHSPQIVLDAFFDAANEELEKYETNN